MNTEERIKTIKQLLNEAFSPSLLEVQDDSALHVGHAGAQQGAGHFTLIIEADAFNGKPLVDCHRLIYQVLDPLMHQEIHALRIQIQQET